MPGVEIRYLTSIRKKPLCLNNLSEVAHYCSSVITQIQNRANLTPRSTSLANLASQADNVQVCRIIRLGWEEVFQVRMRLFDGHPLRAESDAPCHAIDVCVDRESLLSK